MPDLGSNLWSPKLSAKLSVCVLAALLALSPEVSLADESGVSFWLPGQVDSLPAAPGVPGWSMAEVYYHTTVSAFGAVAAARGIQIGRFSPPSYFRFHPSFSPPTTLPSSHPPS